MPAETDFCMELDLGAPPKELLEFARKELGENPETRVQVLEDLRDYIYGQYIGVELSSVLNVVMKNLCYKLLQCLYKCQL